MGRSLLESTIWGGSGAAIRSRVWLFIVIAFYGTAAVAVFNAFWPAKKPGD